MERKLGQGEPSATASLKRERSELPVAREATGRRLPDLTREEILEEEAAGGRLEQGVEQAWIDEATHRYEDIWRGDVDTQDADDVFREARTRLP
jgi:hypothetical protein